LRFPYLRFTDQFNETAYRPALPARLFHQNNSVERVALIDSGSDINVLPYAVGNDLGLSWSELRSVTGLSGNLAKSPAKAAIVKGVIGNFAPVVLAFVWTRNEEVPLLFGQVNFFGEFDICFYRSQGFFDVNLKS
jgi:hypothetical protein